MKLIFLTVPLLLVTLSCFGKPGIKFESVKHDFGEQKQGLVLKHIFKFTNTGKSTLFIEKVSAG